MIKKNPKRLFSPAPCVFVWWRSTRKQKAHFRSPSHSLPSLLVPQRLKLVYQRVVHCIQLMTHKVELEWSQHPVELADFMTIRDYFELQIVSTAGRLLRIANVDLVCEFWHFGVSRIKDDLQSNLIDQCTIERTFGSCANNLPPAWTFDDHEGSLIQRRIIAKVCSAFHRAFAMTLSLDNGNKSYSIMF